MAIIYEINPPKIPPGKPLTEGDCIKLLEQTLNRVSEISSRCNGIHFTDSVLGIPRVSPLTAGKLVRKSNKAIELTVSLRVRDKSPTLIKNFVENGISNNLNGILVLKGDAGTNEKESGLIPSQVVKNLKELGYGEKINFFLSLPNQPDFNKIQKKIQAQPTGFITQVINSIEEVSRIVDKLKPNGFRIVPCVLLPSKKNVKSAQFLKIDWAEYQNSVEDFIKNVHQIAGDVLITSPNDFYFAKEILSKL